MEEALPVMPGNTALRDEAVSQTPLPAAIERAATGGPNLKLRLCLMISLLLALVTAAGGVYVVRRAHADIAGELASSMTLMQRLLEAELEVASDRQTTPGSLPLFRLASLQNIRHVEVEFRNPEGSVVDRLGGGVRSQHLAPDGFRWLVSSTFPPLSEIREPIALHGLLAGELLVRPDAGFEIDEMWSDCRGILQLLAVFFVLVNALVWWVVAHALRPVERVIAALRELTLGRLDTRLPDLGLPELSRLSQGFNDMAQQLEDSLAANRRMTRRLLQMQEAERTHLARELHDELGQCITAIHAEAVTIQRRSERGDAAIAEGAAAIAEAATQTGQLMRTMLRRLRPAALDRLGLGAGLRELVNGFAQRAPGIACSLRVDASLAEMRGEQPIAVYRIVQESLSNVLRHAAAQRVEIEVCRTSREPRGHGIEINVCDDGRGGAQEADHGFGVLGMRERAAALNGQFALNSSPGRGTRIRAWLPFAEQGVAS